MLVQAILGRTCASAFEDTAVLHHYESPRRFSDIRPAACGANRQGDLNFMSSMALQGSIASDIVKIVSSYLNLKLI